MSSPGSGIAPADARRHPHWPAWKKVLAYLVLSLLALVSIWAIDRRAIQLMNPDAAATAPRS